MNLALLIIAIIAVIFVFTGGFIAAVKWLIWVGIILLLLALISWLLRTLSARR